MIVAIRNNKNDLGTNPFNPGKCWIQLPMPNSITNATMHKMRPYKRMMVSRAPPTLALTAELANTSTKKMYIRSAMNVRTKNDNVTALRTRSVTSMDRGVHKLATNEDIVLTILAKKV